MRYQLFKDDFDVNIIYDTINDSVIGKIRITKTAARMCQKLNQAWQKELGSAKIH